MHALPPLPVSLLLPSSFSHPLPHPILFPLLTLFQEGAATTIDLTTDVTLTFALRKLVAFTKSTPLSAAVTLSLSSDVPLVTEYTIGELGYIRFYLAPKIEED